VRLPRTDTFAALLAVAALGAACDSVPRDAVETCAADIRLVPAKTDILVVVDDSTSMEDEQENLRQNLSAFVQALASSAIPHDFQIGVTTTSVDNTHGLVDEYPYYAAPYGGVHIPFPAGRLVAVDPGARTDPDLLGLLLWDAGAGRFTGTRIIPTGSATLVNDFEANVLVGTQGSDKEEPLRAAELALTARIADGTNAGFLRPGARLGVIVLTDEDDCSETVARADQVGTTNDLCHAPDVKARLESLDEFAAFLKGPIDGEARDPVLAVIAGFDPATLSPTPRCGGSYDDPTRLAALVEGFGPGRSFRGSICDASFGPSLQRIADLLVPQTVPLEGAPADARMLLASVRRAGATLRCPVAAEGATDAGTGAVYAPPRGGRRATLTFQGPCRLQAGDQVKLSVVCAE
jgi:hypothetical protein